jgi:NAD(P)-dependent dehydrogenase (short-subunit alcohol dehydrogenase family)
MKTVLITGCSSGYGLATARYFHSKGWNVIATMRTPREDILPRSDRMRALVLDVTKPESIAAYSGPCRPPVPEHAGPPFRSMPARGCDAG